MTTITSFTHVTYYLQVVNLVMPIYKQYRELYKHQLADFTSLKASGGPIRNQEGINMFTQVKINTDTLAFAII